MKAATEVLPLVPVMAAITRGWRGNSFAAASARARRALPTRMKATPPGSDGGGARSAMTATAPAASAFSTKRRPSSLAPAIATNRSPGPTARLSALTPRDLERGEAPIADGVCGEKIGELHGVGHPAARP